MSTIDSATVIKYNANTRGSSVGDCTTRAISLAFNMDYQKIRKMQNDSAKANNYHYFNQLENCKKVIRSLGGGDMIIPSTSVTVGEFADTHSGTYIIFCGKNATGHRSTHLVCIINDRVYDSWDSTTRIVRGYWEITSGVTADDITDIQPYLKSHLITERSIEWYNDYASNILDRIIDRNRKIAKIKNEGNFDIQLIFEIKRVVVNNYTFRFEYEIQISYPQTTIRTQKFENKFAITFKPTMKQDEVDPYFDKTFYSKFTSFIYVLIDKIVDTCEGYNLTREVPNNSKLGFWTTKEEKSFNALPYWVRHLATHFRAEDGDYYDRIRLKMHRAPFDTDYTGDSDDIIEFIADSMPVMRKILDNYKQTGDYQESYDLRYLY